MCLGNSQVITLQHLHQDIFSIFDSTSFNSWGWPNHWALSSFFCSSCLMPLSLIDMSEDGEVEVPFVIATDTTNVPGTP